MVLICPITAPEEGLVYTANNVRLKIGDKIIGKGVLYLSQSTLAWQPDDQADGMSVQWKNINVHGISTTPTKCLYFMLDHELQWPGVYEPRAVNGNAQNGNNANGAHVDVMDEQAMAAENEQPDEDEDEGNVTDEEELENALTECWLLPDDINSVDIIFRAMSDCQELNPDPSDNLSDESDFMDDDDEGHFYVPNMNNPHENDEINADGAQDGIRNLNINDDERFEDADDPS